MKSALFGRMNRSACIDFDVNGLGCSANVLKDMKAKCDQREECRIPNIGDYFINASTNCVNGLEQYLDTVYDCVDDTKGKHRYSHFVQEFQARMIIDLSLNNYYS